MKKQYILAGLMFSMFLCCFTQVQDVHSVSISWCYMFDTSPWCCAEGTFEHGYTLEGVPVYSMSFDKPHTMDGEYYVICPNTNMKLEDISVHNHACDDAITHTYPVNLFAWVYDSGNTQISDTQNGFQLPDDVARSSVFSTKCAVMFTGEGPQTDYLDVYTFTTPGDYIVHVDYLRMYIGLLGCPNQYEWGWSTPCGWGFNAKPGWVASTSYKVRVKTLPVPPPNPDSVCPGTWVAEASLGGFSKHNPVMEAQDGRLVVSVVESDDSVQVNEYTPGSGSSGWYDLGGYITSQTKLARDGGSLGVYGVGGDGLVWRSMYQGPGSWSPWEPTCESNLGVTGPTAVSLGGERYQVVSGSVEIRRCIPIKDVSFVYSVTDDHSPEMSCSLWTDISGTWQKSQTHEYVENGSTNTFVVHNILAGTYEWDVECTDGDGQSAFSLEPSNWEFTIATLPPVTTTTLLPTTTTTLPPTTTTLLLPTTCSETCHEQGHQSGSCKFSCFGDDVEVAYACSPSHYHCCCILMPPELTCSETCQEQGHQSGSCKFSCFGDDVEVAYACSPSSDHCCCILMPPELTCSETCQEQGHQSGSCKFSCTGDDVEVAYACSPSYYGCCCDPAVPELTCSGTCVAQGYSGGNCKFSCRRYEVRVPYSCSRWYYDCCCSF